jgi:hypothetical protein
MMTCSKQLVKTATTQGLYCSRQFDSRLLLGDDITSAMFENRRTAAGWYDVFLK